MPLSDVLNKGQAQASPLLTPAMPLPTAAVTPSVRPETEMPNWWVSESLKAGGMSMVMDWVTLGAAGGVALGLVDESQKLTEQQFKDRVGDREMQFTDGITDNLLDLSILEYDMRQAAMAAAAGSPDDASALVAGRIAGSLILQMLPGMLSPSNIATMGMGVVALQKMSKVPSILRAVRPVLKSNRVLTGAVVGAVEGAASMPIDAALQRLRGQTFTSTDAAIQVGAGMFLGGLMNFGTHAMTFDKVVSQAWADASPRLTSAERVQIVEMALAAGEHPEAMLSVANHLKGPEVKKFKPKDTVLSQVEPAPLERTTIEQPRPPVMDALDVPDAPEPHIRGVPIRVDNTLERALIGAAEGDRSATRRVWRALVRAGVVKESKETFERVSGLIVKAGKASKDAVERKLGGRIPLQTGFTRFAEKLRSKMVEFADDTAPFESVIHETVDGRRVVTPVTFDSKVSRALFVIAGDNQPRVGAFPAEPSQRLGGFAGAEAVRKQLAQLLNVDEVEVQKIADGIYKDVRSITSSGDDTFHVTLEQDVVPRLKGLYQPAHAVKHTTGVDTLLTALVDADALHAGIMSRLPNAGELPDKFELEVFVPKAEPAPVVQTRVAAALEGDKVVSTVKKADGTSEVKTALDEQTDKIMQELDEQLDDDLRAGVHNSIKENGDAVEFVLRETRKCF